MTRRTDSGDALDVGEQRCEQWGTEGHLRVGRCHSQNRARRSANTSSAAMAAISLAALHVRWARSTTTSRPVFTTDARIVALSRGTSDRGSTTSTEIPSPARMSAAFSARLTAPEIATTVTSSPARLTSALPSFTT